MKYTNHLSGEPSPYLRQHVHNPVDWYPWGEEAFARARREGKPVFLSIGYSTCHWCHVMAEESFEDREVAELLNQHFISVKVDREERPDVDAVYMDVCQAVTGLGGWPLTAVLDEEQNPIFVGTYLPKHSHYGRMGLVELLQEIGQKWSQDAQGLRQSGKQLTEYMRERQEGGEENPAPETGWENERKAKELRDFPEYLLTQAVLWFEKQFDAKNGGFGRAPKFPQAHQLVFLLRYGAWKKEKRPQEMAERTLHCMYQGGIFDQIGGGFSRYSTDDQWLVPHFEKMLYDNALLAAAYLEAFDQTGRPEYREAAKRIFAYAERELLQKEGGFSCGQDADSGHEEGKYYLFAKEEILYVLGEERGREFCGFYQITEQGNFEGKNIPNRIGCTPEERPFWWQEAVDLLLSYRKERYELHLDDKVLTSWNSIMILAYARGARILKEPALGERARSCMEFLRQNLRDTKGRLKIRWRKGEAAFPGQLEDYAFYGLACLELHETLGEKEEFVEAVRVAKELDSLFGDAQRGGYFRYSLENEALILRPKESYDGALPSGNGAVALLFARLYRMTGSPAFRDLLDAQLSFLSGEAKAFPAGYTLGLLAYLEAQKGVKVCALGEDSRECKLQGERFLWLMDMGFPLKGEAH